MKRLTSMLFCLAVLTFGGREMLGRTGTCGRGPLPPTAQDGKPQRLPPCYYLPVVTRIEYADGSFRQP